MDGRILAQGMLEKWQDISVLQEAAESIWKRICALQFESGSSKRSKAKWPLSEGGAVVGTPVLGDYPLKRVKQF